MASSLQVGAIVGTRLADLALLQPAFREAIEGLLRDLEAAGIPLQVFETGRSPGRQEALYARGRDPEAADYGRIATRARGYQSAHQFGLGVDLVFHVYGRWTWTEPEPGHWDEMTRLARTRGLEPLSSERPHLQPAGFSSRGRDYGPTDDDAWLAWLRAGASGLHA